jgi:hypothetical protein
MCWCDPNIRTPCCGKPECISPEEKDLKKIAEQYMEEYFTQEFFELWPEKVKQTIIFFVRTAMLFAIRKERSK